MPPKFRPRNWWQYAGSWLWQLEHAPQELNDYLGRNVAALRSAASWHRPDIVIASHLVPGGVVAAPEPDAFPSSDLGLRKSWEALGGAPRSLDEHARTWSPWRAYAAMTLWMHPHRGGGG